MSVAPTTVSGSAVLEPSAPNNTALSVAANGTIAASTSGTVSLTTSVANTIILVGVAIGGSQTVSSISDTRSLTWKKIAAASNSTSVRGELWWAFEPTEQTHTITVNLTASGNAVLVGGSFSGVNTVTAFDPACLASATGSGTGSTDSVMTLNPADMLIGFVACAAAPTLTVGSGFTTVSSTAQSTNVSGGMEYSKLVSASSGSTVNYTLSTSEAWVILSVALMSSGNNTLLIQAPSSEEFILKNIYYGGQCSISKFDGTNTIPIVSPGGAGSQTFNSFQITASNNSSFPSWCLIINTSPASVIAAGYDGARSV